MVVSDCTLSAILQSILSLRNAAIKKVRSRYDRGGADYRFGRGIKGEGCKISGGEVDKKPL